MPKVVCQEWDEVEHEPGWGTSVRSDGYSLHLSEEDRQTFVNNHAGLSLGMYSLGEPYLVNLRTSSKLYQELAATKNGIRKFEKAPQGYRIVN